MDQELHTLLINSDVAGAWENPPDANWASAVAEVKHLKPQLEAALGLELRLDDGVQDASFFADLGLLIEQPTPDGVIYLSYEICFRFSWFAKLYTIHGTTWECRLTERAKVVLAREGFIYVPADELAEPYDGINPPFEAGLTWWTRYFDYL